MKVYVVGSLRRGPSEKVAAALREAGHEVFDDWRAAGPGADDAWRDYSHRRGQTLAEALAGKAAQHVYQYDKKWLEWAEAVVLVLPAGPSGFLEYGRAEGADKPRFVYYEEEPERWDVMLAGATEVCTDVPTLVLAVNEAESERNLREAARKLSSVIPNLWTHAILRDLTESPAEARERGVARVRKMMADQLREQQADASFVCILCGIKIRHAHFLEEYQ